MDRGSDCRSDTGDRADPRRRGPAPPPGPGRRLDRREFPDDPAASQSLARAAEGLAVVVAPSLPPREAIIASYAAMEDALREAPGAEPRESDTPSEVLARAVQLGALRFEAAAPLVRLFTEARFSLHPMGEQHRDEAADLLRRVLDDLGSDACSPSP